MSFRFSIVTAMYNVEDYIEDCIMSLINQKLSFEKNVQMIMVDDGSSDNTLKIAKKYEKLYPNNIIVIAKQNSGVALTRNKGLEYVKGEYINFLDADDTLSLNTLEVVNNFIEKNKSKVKVVAIPLVFFESRSGSHRLNYKFKKSKVFDLRKDFDYIQLSASSSFIESSVLKGMSFKNGLLFGEDALLLNEIFLEYPFLGVVSNCSYNYRKREDSSSTIDTAKDNLYFYTKYLDDFHLEIIDNSLNKKGYLDKFTQYTLLYTLQWHFFENWDDLNVFQKIDKNDYLDKLSKIIKYIDDDIIFNLRKMESEKKLYIYMLKTNLNQIPKISIKNNKYVVKTAEGNYELGDLTYKINLFKYKNSILTIGILYDDFLNLNNVIKINDNQFLPVETYDYVSKKVFNKDLIATKYIIYKIKLEKESLGLIKFISFLDNSKLEVRNLRFGAFSILKNIKNYSSYSENKSFTILKKSGSTSILIKNTSRLSYLFSQKREMLIDIRSRNFNKVKLNIVALFKSKNKKIWLISDRVDMARDNGEALFRYLNQNIINYPNIKPYFVINRNSIDYNRLKSVGKVIAYNSEKHKKLFLKADKIISSHAEIYIKNMFAKEDYDFRQWHNFDFIFLQHGVILHNLFNWLNKVNKNISLFATSAIPEYESLKNYFYNENELKLVGMCRFDILEDKSENLITIFPTWRKNLLSSYDKNTGKWSGNSDDFLKTEYYNFYQRLLSDSELYEKLVENSLYVNFVLHPNFSCYTHLFKGNDHVIIQEGAIDYSKILSTSKCLITDYSSIVFDFVYLNKPIIYSQFDNEEIFKNNYQKGYFDYKSMGFGEVCTDFDSLKEVLLKSIDNGLIMEDKYLKRKNIFFKFNDKQNCKRTMDAIIMQDRG